MGTQERNISAATARLLGYKVNREILANVVLVIQVYSPSGNPVNGARWTSYDERPMYKMKDNEALGHVSVRLHMEKHYGIATNHYWEVT